MTRWFVEEVGPLTVVSRFGLDARVADFTHDGGRTWQEGDRSFDHRRGEDMGIREITEAEALALLETS